MNKIVKQIIGVLVFMVMSVSVADAGALFTYPKFRATNDSGTALQSGKLHTYIAGTTTNKATYSDYNLATANANPVVLDRRGEGIVYGAGSYKFVLKDSAGNTIWTMDNLELGEAGGYLFYPSAAEADHGIASTGGSLKDILTALGTSKRGTIRFIHNGAANTTTYTFSTTYDTTSYTNAKWEIENGATLSIATGVTLTIGSQFEAGLFKVFTLAGTGTIRFGPGSVKEIVPQWFGASPSATAAVNSAAFQAALDSMGTYPSIPLYIPGASTGSVGNYDINVALTKTSADWIRIRGDGPGSWLEWTGADYTTILSLTGLGSGMASVDSVRFDCNGKATTGLQMKGFGHEISVTKCMFNDGLANVADDQGMLDIPIDGETHNGLIRGNWFSGGTAIGLALGLTGASSGSGGFDISGNEFQQQNNWAIKSDGLKESSIRNNIIDNLLANTLAGGFYLDSSSNLTIDNNHAESLTKEFLLLNPTGRYAFFPMTAKVTNNFITNGGISHINLGYTDGVEVTGNTVLDNAGLNWLTVTANANNTIVGKNQLGTTAGALSWHEQYITGAGFWTNRATMQPVVSTNAVLTLTNQSASAAWVELTPISTLNNPDIPADARGYRVEVSIMSATVGARLYIVNEGNAPAWANRATDTRVKYIEAQTANRYNTATFDIPVKNQSYLDALYYSIDPTGVTDTNVEIRVVGYLMPT